MILPTKDKAKEMSIKIRLDESKAFEEIPLG